MHLKTFLFSTLLFILPIVHAVGIGQVNGANLALQEETQKDDSNVEAINVANALLKSKGVATDLATLAAGIGSSVQNGQGTAATNDPGTEQSVVNQFGGLCDAIVNYMNDLAAKVTPLTLGGQKSSISKSLTTLFANLNDLANFIQGLVEGDAYQDEVDDDSSNADEAIVNAQNVFAG